MCPCAIAQSSAVSDPQHNSTKWLNQEIHWTMIKIILGAGYLFQQKDYN